LLVTGLTQNVARKLREIRNNPGHWRGMQSAVPAALGGRKLQEAPPN
jgi:hypothetical protein